jgi:regulator of nonsense transcripts 1
VKRTPCDSEGKTRLGPMLSLLNPTQQNAFIRSHDTRRPALVVQGPSGTGKTYALAVISLSYSLVRKMKCLICTPSNNAGNATTDKIMDVWTKENTRLGLGCLKIVRWLTPTAEHCIMTTGRAVGIPESMASISVASHIRAYAQSLADTHGGDEWLRLCRRLGSLSQNDYERFKYLTTEYERHCLGQMDIVVTTCDNSWTLRPKQFQLNIIILDKCSQAIEAAALLPVVQFIGRLEQVIFTGDDQQLQPFVLSAPEENEFACQLRKSWFERARLSAVVPCVTLGQQYRMRPEILRLIIHHFYRNKLENDTSTMVDRPAYLAYMQVAQELNLGGIYWAATEWPVSNVLMVDMPEGTRTLSRTDRAGSKFNNGHIAIVCEICLTLLAPQTDIYGRQIAVITPYAAQRDRHIRAMSEATRLNLEMGKVIVSTVDRFQGQEADIVLLDLVVRSNETDGLGFMRDKNRLNVAISRARDVLIVIGDGRKYRRLLSKP